MTKKKKKHRSRTTIKLVKRNLQVVYEAKPAILWLQSGKRKTSGGSKIPELSPSLDKPYPQQLTKISPQGFRKGPGEKEKVLNLMKMFTLFFMGNIFNLILGFICNDPLLYQSVFFFAENVTLGKKLTHMTAHKKHFIWRLACHQKRSVVRGPARQPSSDSSSCYPSTVHGPYNIQNDLDYRNPDYCYLDSSGHFFFFLLAILSEVTSSPCSKPSYSFSPH